MDIRSDLIKSKLNFKHAILSVSGGYNCFSKLWRWIHGKLNLLNVYPNPVSTILNIDYQMNSGSDINFILSDMNGKQFILKKTQNIIPGIHTENVDVSGFESGRYLLILHSGGVFDSQILEIGK
jgi:hypothetical protein